jgi:hypothetical protein
MVNKEGGEELTPPSMARLQFNVGDNEEEIQPVIALCNIRNLSAVLNRYYYLYLSIPK